MSKKIQLPSDITVPPSIKTTDFEVLIKKQVALFTRKRPLFLRKKPLIRAISQLFCGYSA